MGWKGTARSLRSTYRSIKREEKRQQNALQREEAKRHRELKKRLKELEKMEALEQATYEVDVYENQIEMIQSVHKEWGDLIDWKAISESQEPVKPIQETKNQDSFKAGLFTKIFGGEAKKKEKAIAQDETDFKDAYSQWQIEHKEWKEDKSLADRLFSGDEKSKVDIIEKMNPFSEIEELGESLRFEINENSIVETILNPFGDDVVPSERKTLLQSGKLSVKKMPVGMFNEIYQDYVCSCILRLGNELLAILPDEIVLVHIMDDLLNKKTGHKEQQCIVSVAISRETIANLNMDMIDPSDSLENFVHNMKFMKTKGFGAVEKISPIDFNS